MGRRLVIGLGNPGPEYERTWHNLGFRVVRSLAKRMKVSLKQHEDALVGQGRYLGHEVTLILPSLYMNRSGIPVLGWAKKLNLFEEDILVIYDDHDLPRGSLRMKPFGGDGGHRGLRSVLYETGTDNIPRLRVGIRDEESDPEAGGYEDLADRVLEELSDEEFKYLELVAKGASAAVVEWLRNGITVSMNRHNNRRIYQPGKEPEPKNKHKNTQTPGPGEKIE
jgi:PTH1 family peptidyl-tRNA hydrolase